MFFCHNNCLYTKCTHIIKYSYSAKSCSNDADLYKRGAHKHSEYRVCVGGYLVGYIKSIIVWS